MSAEIFTTEQPAPTSAKGTAAMTPLPARGLFRVLDREHSMNYYEHHIGDYAQATFHLTFVEDAAYSRLIRRYYAEEKPLPADVAQVQRLVCARTKEERDAVELVLKEFFTLHEDGWHQSRCDEEIARFQERSAKARASSRLGVEARKRIANADQSNDRTVDQSVTERLTEGSPPRARSIHQTPDTSLQAPDQDQVTPDGVTRPPSALRPEDRTPHQAIIDLYHECLPHNPKVKAWTDARRALLRQRWKDDPDLEGWRRYFEYVAKSPFLTGRAKPQDGKPPFVADLEWLLRESNQVKVIEGKFHRG